MKTQLRSIITVFMISVLLFGCSNKQSKIVNVELSEETRIFNSMNSSAFAQKFKFENVDSKKYQLKLNHYISGDLKEEIILADKIEGSEFYISAITPTAIKEEYSNKNIPMYLSYSTFYNPGGLGTSTREISIQNYDTMSTLVNVNEDDKILNDDNTTIELIRYIKSVDSSGMNDDFDFSKKVYEGDVLLILLEPIK